VPKAGDYISSEKSVTTQFQTMTNRDFMNRIYILRYEDCVELMKASMKSFDQPMFLEALTKLYFSFIVPRLHILEGKHKDKLVQSRINKEEGVALLIDIATYMHGLGVNRPEKEQSDLDHVVMEEMEFKQG